MMKKSIMLCILACSPFIFAQHNNLNATNKVTFMNYKSFKAFKKNSDKVIDSIGFKIIEGDTIISINGYESKGVKVQYEEKDSIF
jgi:hypothetical protein